VSHAPDIDVVVPAYNEERHLERCLDAVLAQDYPPELVRVWVVDAGSTDATAEIASRREATEPRLTVVSEGGRLWQADAMNRGIAAGTSELVARVDARMFVAPDYLTRAVEAFAEEGAGLALVAGQPEMSGETAFGRALAIARRSPFGVGASVYAKRSSAQRIAVDTVQCGVYRRVALEAVGGFDPQMTYGEDEELNWRLRRDGWRILLDTRLRVAYVTRSSWREAFRQYRNYGTGRARVVAAHPEFLRLHHLAPAAMVSGTVGIAAFTPWSRTARRALAAAALAYVGAGTAAALMGPEHTRSLAPRVVAAFLALHIGYGAGTLHEFPVFAEAVARRVRLGGTEAGS
jgi:succinoglycan biosynthesis protein ExoA